MTNIDNRLAVVTGASSGIGKAIAIGLAAKTATLYLVARNSENLEAVAKVARRGGTNVRCFKTDLLLDNDIQKLGDDIKRDFGYVDILIHSAGVISLGGLEQSRVEELDWQYRINVRAPYLLTQLLLPMIKPRHGKIVFINSSAGLKKNRANVGLYAATKHALKAMADCLREELNTCGVHVISIFPESTATPMQEYVQKMEGNLYQPERFMQPEDVAQVAINSLSLPRSKATDIKCFSKRSRRARFLNHLSNFIQNR